MRCRVLSQCFLNVAIIDIWRKPPAVWLAIRLRYPPSVAALGLPGFPWRSRTLPNDGDIKPCGCAPNVGNEPYYERKSCGRHDVRIAISELSVCWADLRRGGLTTCIEWSSGRAYLVSEHTVSLVEHAKCLAMLDAGTVLFGEAFPRLQILA
nr:hypothetical protein CFP56_21334 [Quercus suber]